MLRTMIVYIKYTSSRDLMVFGDAMLSTTLTPAIGWCLGKQWDEQRRSRYIESTCWRATDQPDVLDSHFRWGHGWYCSVDQWYQYRDNQTIFYRTLLKSSWVETPFAIPTKHGEKTVTTRIWLSFATKRTFLLMYSNEATSLYRRFTILYASIQMILRVSILMVTGILRHHPKGIQWFLSELSTAVEIVKSYGDVRWQ